ncbi:hypothetical protein MSG28_007469 [Choristoneura fumiferana]|uniref:Uncharacterized protein n=1 Tax=Choristoneura fumiferana TaxID=7141 RepID=A0ACC0JXB0_CHOFU|nr:hypothetical protein MSG28_007469 [Choristoneura fumiferana]
MGSNQSVRSTHFSRPLPKPPQFDDTEDNHISISNKMVERLVEDATIAGGAAASVPVPPMPRGDYKEKIFMEKMKCLDESHSERSKITVDDLNSLARRIEMRTANMIALDPVCAESKQKVIDCYNERDAVADVVKCWNTIGE